MKKEIVQDILSVEIDGKTIVSRIFDFEALCMIQSKHYGRDGGSANICYEAMLYLFEGTEATETKIKALSVAQQGALCERLFRIYAKTNAEIASLEKNM